MFDKADENATLRQLGVRPKGQTGCGACDAAGFLQCKCAKKGGGGGSAGGDNKSAKDKEELAFTHSLASKLTGHHPKLSELKLIFGFFDTIKEPVIEEKVIYSHLQLLKKEFDEFIKECKQRGISTEGFIAEIKDAKLHITIPDAKLHDEFILRLMEKQLFNPTQNAHEDDVVQSSLPSPFSMRMKPAGFR